MIDLQQTADEILCPAIRMYLIAGGTVREIEHEAWRQAETWATEIAEMRERLGNA